MATYRNAAGTRAPLLSGWEGLTPPPKKTKPKSPKAGIAPPPTPFDEAQKTVDQIIAAMLGDVARQRDEARAQAELEANRKLAEGQALAHGLQQLGISQAVQSAFQNAGQAQAGLAQGFSGATRDAANAAAAEQMRALSGTGQEGAVRNAGEAMGNVTYGLGYIPATELNTTGAAFGAQAALQPGFAMQFAQLEKAARDHQWAEELSKFSDMEDEIRGKQPEMFLDYADKFGAFDAPKTAAASKNTIRTLSNGQLQAFNAQGKPVGKPYGPTRQTTAKSSNLQARTMANGQIQWFDPATGSPVGKPQGPARKTTKKGKDGQEYNLQFKTFGTYGQWYDPRTGRPVGGRVPIPKKSKTSTKDAGRPDGMTPTQVRAARGSAFQIVNGWQRNGRKDDEGNDYLPKDLLKYMIQEEQIPFDIAVRALAKSYKPALKWFKEQKAIRPEKGALTLPASFTPTHETDGLAGYPAKDIMGRPGTPVASPASGTIVRHGSAQGGEALYLQADDGTMYWIGHIDSMLPVGTRVRKGETLARISADHPRPHVHLAKSSGQNA